MADETSVAFLVMLAGIMLFPFLNLKRWLTTKKQTIVGDA